MEPGGWGPESKHSESEILGRQICQKCACKCIVLTYAWKCPQKEKKWNTSRLLADLRVYFEVTTVTNDTVVIVLTQYTTTMDLEEKISRHDQTFRSNKMF